MLISFCGFVEALMLFMNFRDGGPMQAAVNRTATSQLAFWVMVAFACVKFYACWRIHVQFRREF